MSVTHTVPLPTGLAVEQGWGLALASGSSLTLLFHRLSPASSCKRSSWYLWGPGAVAKLVPSCSASARASSPPCFAPAPPQFHSSFQLKYLSYSVFCLLSGGVRVGVGVGGRGGALLHVRAFSRTVSVASCGGDSGPASATIPAVKPAECPRSGSCVCSAWPHWHVLPFPRRPSSSSLQTPLLLWGLAVPIHLCHSPFPSAGTHDPLPELQSGSIHILPALAS